MCGNQLRVLPEAPTVERLARGRELILAWGEKPVLVHDGALYIRDGTVVEAGSYADLRGRYPGVPVVGEGSHVVVPGFVNAHSHGRGISTLRQGFSDEPLELRSVGLRGSLLRDPYWDVRYSCVRQLRAGITTTVHADSYYAGSAEDYEHRLRRVLEAYRDSGMRFRVALGIKDQNSFTYVDDETFLAGLPVALRKDMAAWPRPRLGAEDYVALYERLEADYGCDVLQFGPTNPVWCSDGLLEALQGHATARGIKLHIHLLETVYQRAYALRRYGRTAVARLEMLGLLSPATTLVHCVWTSDEDLERLAAAGISVAHNPSSNLRLRSGIAPIPAMMRRHISIGLGIDSLGMNDDDDMLQEIRLAHLLHSRPGIAARAISPGVILEWATAGGARIAGDDTIGRLTPGSRADMLFLTVEEVAACRAGNAEAVAAVLVQRPRTFRVDGVMISGVLLVWHGKLLGYDGDEVELRALDSWTPQPVPSWLHALRAEVVRTLASWQGDDGVPAF